VLYLLWERGAFTNEEIGTIFGVSYSAVSHIVRRVKSELKKDKNCQGKQDLIISQIKMTPFTINSIVHRDYSSSSDSIVKIFDDRIEFFSPGSLPAGLTVKKLLSGDYIPVISNRVIEDIFREGGLIENMVTCRRHLVITLFPNQDSRRSQEESLRG
jgi:transcriptional regulator